MPAGDAAQSDQMRTDSDPELVEIDSRGLPPEALEWADTTMRSGGGFHYF